MMAVALSFFPSPPVGEGPEPLTGGEAGEGSAAQRMARIQPLSRLAFASLGDPPSPTRGEGKRRNAR